MGEIYCFLNSFIKTNLCGQFLPQCSKDDKLSEISGRTTDFLLPLPNSTADKMMTQQLPCPCVQPCEQRGLMSMSALNENTNREGILQTPPSRWTLHGESNVCGSSMLSFCSGTWFWPCVPWMASSSCLCTELSFFLSLLLRRKLGCLHKNGSVLVCWLSWACWGKKKEDVVFGVDFYPRRYHMKQCGLDSVQLLIIQGDRKSEWGVILTNVLFIIRYMFSSYSQRLTSIQTSADFSASF